MSLFEGYDRYDGIIITSLIGIFAGLSNYYFWFTLDDAYIALRYSKNLANGNGLVWNVMSNNPVEGYTSFLWVLIGALPHSLGIPAITFVKILGVFATILCLIIIYMYGRRQGIGRIFVAIGCAQIAVSPAVAVLSVQGMETTTAMLLALIASIGALELVKTYSHRWAIAMNAALFLSMLTRPDLVIYSVILEAGVAGVLYYKNRTADIRSLVRWGIVLVFVPGVVYMIARSLYFGYLFPNPFYVKSGLSKGILSIRGAEYIFRFVMHLLGPLLFITIYSSIIKENSNRVINVSPVLFASAGFLLLYLFIDPKQGEVFRFQAPALAAVILSLLLVLNPKLNVFKSKVNSSKINTIVEQKVPLIMTLLLISGFMIYPVFSLNHANNAANSQLSGDRVVVGQALDSIDQNHKMFVSESGATPYYSEWNARDLLGLNSEKIAHNGMSESYLREYDPDLILLNIRVQPALFKKFSPPTAKFINSSSYRLVAVVEKSNRDLTKFKKGDPHMYFVDKNAEEYQEISCTILTQNLSYTNRSAVLNQAEIDVQPSHITRDTC